MVEDDGDAEIGDMSVLVGPCDGRVFLEGLAAVVVVSCVV